jgi:ferritin-like metal-binding protein YciE
VGAFAPASAGRRRETEQHESRVRAALQARAATPSAFKDVVLHAGGLGFALFARLQPDTPGKLVAHAFSYEHLELGRYELLARVARRAGDDEVAAMRSHAERRAGRPAPAAGACYLLRS